MTNRVHIDAPAGVIEIEGEKDFVEGLLSKIFPMIEEAGFGSRPRSPNSRVDDQEDPSTNNEAGTESDNGKSRVKRRRGSPAPKGQSCADRIVSLKDSGFFKQHRVGGDIVAGLAAKGWTYKSNQVAAATGALFDRGQLQRTKDGKGPWTYYWDRD
jgi:hypothetical protein